MKVRDPAELECREVVELVTEYLGEALDPDDRARLEQHLLVCPPCAMHVDQVRSTVDHLRALGRSDAPAAVGPALLERFRRRSDP